EEPPFCTCCGTLLTVKHILTECRIYDKERRLYRISNLLDEALNLDPNNQLAEADPDDFKFDHRRRPLVQRFQLTNCELYLICVPLIRYSSTP
ncbi:Uncharacterized protein FWK35_00034948, partial [Aphis craccivora]